MLYLDNAVFPYPLFLLLHLPSANVLIPQSLTGCHVSRELYTKLRMARKLKDMNIDVGILEGAKKTFRHRMLPVTDETIDAATDFIVQGSQTMAHGDRALILSSTGETVRVAKMMRTEPIHAMESKFNALRKKEGKQGLSHEHFYELASCICPSILKNMAALDPVREKYGRDNFVSMGNVYVELSRLSNGIEGLPDSLQLKIQQAMQQINIVDAFMKDKHNGFQAHFGTDSKCSSHCASHAFGATVIGEEQHGGHAAPTSFAEGCSQCASMSVLHTMTLDIIREVKEWSTGKMVETVGLVHELCIVLERQTVRMWHYVDHMARIAWESDLQVSA
jgi:hypothetical protein